MNILLESRMKKLVKHKKPRVIWVTEDCIWKVLRGYWNYTKRDNLAENGCKRCKPVKFVEVV